MELQECKNELKKIYAGIGEYCKQNPRTRDVVQSKIDIIQDELKSLGMVGVL